MRAGVVALGVVVVGAATVDANAQILKLDGPSAPELGDQSSLIALGARLDAERASILEMRDPTGTVGVDVGLRVRGAVRGVASALATVTDPYAGTGAIEALAGLRLADAMVALDALASQIADRGVAGARATASQSPDLEAIAAWERSRSMGEAIARRCDRLAERILTDPRSLDDPAALDSALTEITTELRGLIDGGDAIAPAWVTPVASTALGTVESAAKSIAGIALKDSVRASVDAAYEALRNGETDPSSRAEVRALAWKIADAVRAIESLDAARVTPSVAEGVAIACEAIAHPGSRAPGAARISIIGSLGSVANRAMTLEKDGVTIDGIREALGVISLGLTVPLGAPGASDGDAPALVRAMDRVLEDSEAAPRRAGLSFRDPRFNRAWRALVKQFEGIEQKAFDLCARGARAPSVLSTPEWVTGASALHESRRTLERIVALPDWIAELRADGASPISGSVRAGAADRLNVIRIGIGFDEHREGALAALAQWESMRALAGGLPGESLVRANDPRVEVVTRSRASALARVMEVARQEWIGAWGRAEDLELLEADKRIRVLERVGEALVDAAALRDDDLPARVSRWAPVRISAPAFDAVRARAEAVLGEACAAATGAEWSHLTDLLGEWDRSCECARALARLGAWSASREDWPGETGVAGVVATVGASPPADAWGAANRGALAALSVWSAELEGCVARGDRGMADAIVRWMNHLAEPVAQEMRRTPM